MYIENFYGYIIVVSGGLRVCPGADIGRRHITDALFVLQYHLLLLGSADRLFTARRRQIARAVTVVAL